MVFDMPPIPFSVHDVALKKTVYVRSSCDHTENKTITLLVSETMFPIEKQVFTAVKVAFRTDGVTIVNVCRRNEE